MPQLQLTDERFTVQADVEEQRESQDYVPRASHPVLAGVEADGMVFSNPAEGWRAFPHPKEIEALVDEDMSTHQASLPEEVREAIDQLTDDPSIGEFLVLDASDAYEYLEEIQRQSDKHLETFYRKQLLRDMMSNESGYSSGASLSTYDKRWIVRWEIERRRATRDIDEWKDCYLSTDNRGLPAAAEGGDETGEAGNAAEVPA